MKLRTSIAFVAGILLCAGVADGDQAGPSPVKVFVLAGQSNMQGHGEISPVTSVNTLEHLEAYDRAGEYEFLGRRGRWTVRDDVWIHYERSPGNLLTADLTAGYGVSNTTIGPELGFGHVMGDYFENQVLIVKTAWGGKSLAVDFRPPSSGGTTGFYYNEVVRLYRDATARLASHFPDYDGEGFELAGFGWHQGWNDRVNQAHNDEYEFNMVNFVRDMGTSLRRRDLPFVIATTGMTGWTETHPRALSLMNAQLAVAQYPVFQGRVFTVDTRDFWRPADQSPADQGFHWNRNAATYVDIGVSMGRAMVKLIDYDTWVDRFPDVDLGDRAADLDGDALSNDAERLFGLDPTNASSRNPITTLPDRATGSFSYTRREVSRSGFQFTVWTSSDLEEWTEDTTAVQVPRTPADDQVETVDVTLSPALLDEPDLYVQIRASE